MARVLIVDDASFMRSSLKYIVEHMGHEVVGVAKDGREGVDLHRTLKPDLVTMDMLMEPMGGMEALQALMAEKTHAKVIMVTAVGMEQVEHEAVANGASGYIRKPFERRQIIDEVERVLGEASDKTDSRAGSG